MGSSAIKPPSTFAEENSAAAGTVHVALSVAAVLLGLETYFGNIMFSENAAMMAVCYPLAVLALCFGWRANSARPIGERQTAGYIITLALAVWQIVCLIANAGILFIESYQWVYITILPCALLLNPNPRAARTQTGIAAALVVLPMILFGWLGVYMWRIGATNASMSFIRLPGSFIITEQTHFEDSRLMLFLINSNLLAPIALGGALLSIWRLMPSPGGSARKGDKKSFIRAIWIIIIKLYFLIGAIMSYLVLILTQTATAYIALCAAAAFIAFLLTLRAFQAPSANSEGRTGSRRPFMQRKGAWPLRALAAIMMAAILFIATYLISDPVRDLIRWSPSPASAESAIPSAEEGAAGEGMSSAAQTPPSISLIASDAPDSITGASETAPSAEATAEATVAPTVSPAPLAWRAGHTFQSKDILQRLETLLSGDNRMQVWRLIFTMFKSDPARLLFGIAPSDMREALYPYAEASGASNLAAIINNNNAHNSYLQTILSSGLPGLILWLALAAWAFFPAARKCLNRGVPARSAFLLGFAAACLIMGLAESHYLAQGFVMNLVFFIALGAARTEAADDGQADR